MKAVFLVCVVILCTACASKPTETKVEEKKHPAIFTDITEKSKLHFINDPAVEGKFFFPEIMGFGCAFLDYDNDGDLDIYLLNGAWREKKENPPLKNRLFRQDAGGIFHDVTDASGLTGKAYSQGVAVGDIDNDGDLDVFLCNYGPDELYRNNGDGTFTDISSSSGILKDNYWSSSAVFFDYDRDGFLDLYVANYVTYNESVICTDKAGRRDYCGPAGFRAEPDVLYHNQGNGTFRDVSKASRIETQALKGLGVVAADFNEDGWDDIYVANDGEPSHLWMNRKNGTFADEALALGAAVNAMGRPEAGMGIALGDVENDGDLDLFITHLRDETNTLYRKTGPSGFQDDTAYSGLGGPSLSYTGFGTGFLDYDHDGDLDLPLVNGRVTRGTLLIRTGSYWDDFAEPNLFFENIGQARFQDISKHVPDFASKIENSRGLSFGDVDNDGDIDLLILNAGGPARLLRNDYSEKGHWLMIRAMDPSLNRDAIGAMITVDAGGKRLRRLLNPAYSYQSSNDFRVHFGLGPATETERIEVRWPDGTLEEFAGTKANQMITLQKGTSTK